jgi:hypothetical protein
MSVPFAHETWFDHAAYPTDWGFAGENLTLALLAGAVRAAGDLRRSGAGDHPDRRDP